MKRTVMIRRKERNLLYFLVEHPLSEESGGCDQFLEKERSRAIFNKATFIAEN
jgi:hypothetical protein